MKEMIKKLVVCLLCIGIFFGMQFISGQVSSFISGYTVAKEMDAEGIKLDTAENMQIFYERARKMSLSNLGTVSFISSAVSVMIFILIARGSKKKAANKEGTKVSGKELMHSAVKELGFRKISFKKVLSAFIAGLGMTGFINGVLGILPLPMWLVNSYSSASSAVSNMGLIGQLIGVTIAPAIAEEVLFRGVILGNLRKVMPTWLAVVLSSAAFGLVHGNLLWMAYTFVMGIIVAVMDIKFDSIIPGMIMHLVFNLYGVLTGGLALPAAVYAGFALMGLGILVICMSGGRYQTGKTAAA